MYQRVRGGASGDAGDAGDAESSKARDDNPPCHPRSPDGGLSDNGEADYPNDGSQPREDVYRTEPGDGKHFLRSARSKGRDNTLRRDSANQGDNEGGKGQLANAEPSVQPPNSKGPTRPHRVIGRRRHCDVDDEEDNFTIESSNAEHSDGDVVPPSRRKRRRMGTSARPIRGTAAQQQPHRYHTPPRSQQIQRSSLYVKRRSQHSNPSPPSSRGSILGEERVEASVAKFEEWPLGNAVFKRVTLNGIPTFQLQFTWDPCVKHEGHRITENQSSASPAQRHHSARQRSTRSTKDESTTANSKPALRKTRYTPQDDAKIRLLKGQGLSWPTIAEQFPGRSPEAIAVRYHAKLKTNPSHVAPQRWSEPQMLSVADDSSEEGWEVEEICSHRKPEDGRLNFLVRWKGGEETWEPFENVAETEALDRYERLHGLVVVLVRDLS